MTWPTASAVAALVAEWGRARVHRRRPAVLLATGLAALLLAGCGTAAEDTPVVSGLTTSSDGYDGYALDRPYVVPTTTLTGSDGRPRTLPDDLDRDVTLMFFGYTRCPDVCQAVMASIASAVVRLDDAQRTRVGVVFVTTDPARDTPAVLRDYLSRFDPSFVGLTGPLGRIVALGTPLAVDIEGGTKLPGGGYEVTHSAQVLAVRDGRVPLLWTQDVSPAQLVRDLDQLLAS